MGIVVLGAVFVDIKGYPLSKYIPGGRNVGRVEEVHGGVARNVVEDIANVELRPTFLSLVDYSGTGLGVLEKLNKHKVCTQYMRKTENGLGTWLAVFGNDGDVVASISKRPDLSPVLDIIREHGDEIFSKADSIVIEFDMDKEIVKQVIAYGKKYGKQVYAVVSNMSIAAERRDLLKDVGCLVCNVQEAGMLFSEDYEGRSPEEMSDCIAEKVMAAKIPRMVVTLGREGAVYASMDGAEKGWVPARKVDVVDTTGAGDSFFAGVAIGLTYGKNLRESCEIGTRLAGAVICSKENVCPRFMPSEFGLDVEVE